MRKFLVSNIADRPHRKIYASLGNNAFFDLAPGQHGWVDFCSISKGDWVYVINANRKIPVAYQVEAILDEIETEEHQILGSRLVSAIGGHTRVLFGKPVKRVDTIYTKFVSDNVVTSSKLRPDGQMYQGFNCAEVVDEYL
ncbi:hypothetical protein A9267_08980 [Shewanella sp. UCD-FRSSP16_17]|uniref:hypothetical protein n=1 Tax=Shewanella sp. UCD-FRSSP16_17 TaxID=1853256 RepID=UPI0007EEBB2D|nr:hypothetical protein [Shewanella sp. UCD-FRSSP16_17]OBT09313.1 hypothetical protein A9267_08980 [Shewanella sp. UCD-FRSSP16_17]